MTALPRLLACVLVAVALGATARAQPASAPFEAKVQMRWGVKIPLRDGVRLNATVYTPRTQAAPAPCVFTLTPYIGESYHDRGVYFAEHGLPFLTVDVRGRGNSEGEFRPLIQEAQDGYDVVEWLAKQPYCNGKVAMWGGSYAGYDQWATAKLRPPHLATIVPVASPWAGADFPYRNNIGQPYPFQWLLFVGGRALQPGIFGDTAFWASMWRERYEKGLAFDTLGQTFGFDPPALREWIAHPEVDAYWDAYNPTDAQVRALTLPILTITGSYDDDQPGALTLYRKAMQSASPEERARHYLVIGPWDHAGTRTPRPEVGGVKFGPASLVDLPALHVDWYRWTMADGQKPAFLQKPVAYYVMGAERWRYADSLEAVTARSTPYYLDSSGEAGSLVHSGALATTVPSKGGADTYVYDPRDTSGAALEARLDPYDLTDQQLLTANDGKHLVYHSAPFAQDTEVSGVFKLSAWIAIDRPDTDFQAAVYEIDAKGRSIRLSTDVLRARYREGLRASRPITTAKPQRYDFGSFTFVSRRIARGSRLRLVVGPIDSIYSQRNFNAAKPVATQAMQDARPVKVRLVHDSAHPSALFVPFGQPE